MNADQIEKMLFNICKEKYIGVYPWNKLPMKLPTLPCLLVANTDCNHLPGVHWITIYINRAGCGEYFDSLGHMPMSYFETYLNSQCVSCTFNVRQLQNVASSFYGHYCIFYCSYHRVNFSMNTIASWFISDTRLNDMLLHKFVHRRIKLHISLCLHVFITQQRTHNILQN